MLHGSSRDLIYVLTQAADREKDRVLERYKLIAEQNIAEAHHSAAHARAEAAVAHADAERAKLETIRTSEKLAKTQQRLDTANLIEPSTQQQVETIVHGVLNLALADNNVVWMAANDRQAQERLFQIFTALRNVDSKHDTKAASTLLHMQFGTSFFEAPKGEQGDFMVHYWINENRAMADAITNVFRQAGFKTTAYQLSPEPDETARAATLKMILIGIAVRPVPTFSKH